MPEALVAFCCAFVLYTATLAPTIVWGDSAKLTNAALTRAIYPAFSSHPLHTVLAQLFLRLPIGDPAHRLNLMSAVFGAFAVAAVFATLRALGVSRIAAALGSGSLMVSHTFWMTSVITESYAPASAALAAGFWCVARWLRGRGGGWLFGAVAWPALAFACHALTVLFIVALAVGLLRNRRLDRRAALILAAGALVGVAAYALIIAYSVQVNGLERVQQVLATARQEERLWLTWPGPAAFVTGLLSAALLLAYQFLPLSIVLACLGGRSLRQRSPLYFDTAVILILLSVAFMACYGRQRQFLMGLPGYVAGSFLIGFGWESLRTGWLQRKPILLYTLGVAALACGPLTYAGAAGLLHARHATLGVRPLRYRDPVKFFLYPPKQGDDGARRFAEEVVDAAPPRAVILADFTMLGPLRYLALTTKRADGLSFTIIDPPLTPLDVHEVQGWLRSGRRVWLLDPEAGGVNLADLRKSVTVAPVSPFGYELGRGDAAPQGANP